jgi:hypothetical protein
LKIIYYSGLALGVRALAYPEFLRTIVGLILAESGDEASDEISYS